MRRIITIIAALGLLVGMLPGASAGPGAQGFSSDNIEQVTFLPFEAGTATGADFFNQGKNRYMIVTSWKNFNIYDINDPASPELVSTVPFGFQFENEDVSTNGKIMLFSESLPRNVLHVWDIEDVTNPVEISQVPGAGQHTTSCILDCQWAYGSNGAITDLRNPAKPKLLKEKWNDGLEAIGGFHDVREVAHGLVLSASQPMVFLDARKDPAHPKLLATSALNEQVGEAPVHSNQWPRNAKDDFVLVTGESWSPTNGSGRCTEDRNQGFSTWDATKWKKTQSFTRIDVFKAKNGTVVDGGSAVNAPFGCSSHWFEAHPDWKNGGLVAAGWYSHGTRILKVDSKGKISEIGYFLPHGGGTSAAYWVDDEYIYSVDYQRGIDVLRYTGKV
ncbi:MAG: LVIVD repeat-containing protein [Actinomycetota bacterium]